MSEAAHINVVRIPGPELTKWEDAGFVLATFARSLGRSPRHLEALLDKPGTVVVLATPVGDPTLVGWLMARPAENRIVCAYTKAAYRASPEQRAGEPLSEGADAFRIASSLALAAGIDFARPVPCSFWSRAARAISEKEGNPYSLRYAPEVQ